MNDKRKALGEALKELVSDARSGGVRKTRIGIMSVGSEITFTRVDMGQKNIMEGALAAVDLDPRVEPVLIGPRMEDARGFDWIETGECETDVAEGLRNALDSGAIEGAVALHYPFPIGVTTIGRVVTPARGRSMFIASTTGASSTDRVEAMIRNAVYGIATAKATGITHPTVGVLNVDGASMVNRALMQLHDGGYEITFAESTRRDGGSVLRGNDLLWGAVDVCVTDTLTGNVLMKMFSAWNSGGSYETLGWGYGPSVGEGWNDVVAIVSRISGAPVIASAMSYAAKCVQGKLAERVKEELKSARACGLDRILGDLRKAQQPAGAAEATPPPAEPTDEEIHGIDVLDIERAVQALWAVGVYAESSMGCTGPVVKVSSAKMESAKKILTDGGFI